MNIFKITRKSGIPLIGSLSFGVIDRGTNLIQVRPTSICNLKCSFCSTNANNPDMHPFVYDVELDYLVDWVKHVVDFKGEGVELNFDSVGEILMYKDFVKLVTTCSKIKGVSYASMQTNGVLLTEKLVDSLYKAGIRRINLSMNSLDPEKAKKLAGSSSYDITKIKSIAGYISKSKINLLIAPVWLPSVNDNDIEDIIKFASSLGVKLGVQKYEVYKYGRKYRDAKNLNWWKFYDKLKSWEKKYNISLMLTAKDFNIRKMNRMPSVFRKGDKINVIVKAPGWLKGQMIGVSNNRCVSINNCNAKLEDKLRVKILEDKNELYVAEVL